MGIRWIRWILRFGRILRFLRILWLTWILRFRRILRFLRVLWLAWILRLRRIYRLRRCYRMTLSNWDSSRRHGWRIYRWASLSFSRCRREGCSRGGGWREQCCLWFQHVRRIVDTVEAVEALSVLRVQRQNLLGHRHQRRAIVPGNCVKMDVLFGDGRILIRGVRFGKGRAIGEGTPCLVLIERMLCIDARCSVICVNSDIVERCFF